MFVYGGFKKLLHQHPTSPPPPPKTVESQMYYVGIYDNPILMKLDNKRSTCPDGYLSSTNLHLMQYSKYMYIANDVLLMVTF